MRPPAGTTDQEWLDGLRATTTDEYLGVLAGVDPANIPATRVTGEPRAGRGSRRARCRCRCRPTRSTLLVLVVTTEDGWRVAGYDRE